MKKNIALILLKICIVCPIFLLFCSFSVLCEENPPTDNFPPIIVSVSEPQTISCTDSALLYADVIDESAIGEVWAEVISLKNGDTTVPVTEIPSIKLVFLEKNRYQGSCNKFVTEGTYKIIIYAEDVNGNRSDAEETSVTLLKNKAIIIAGGGYEGDILWDATRKCANIAYYALINQGYSSDKVHYLSSATESDANGKNIVDGNAGKSDLEAAINTWAKQDPYYGLFLYMVDHGGNGTFRMKDDTLAASELDSWLDKLQQTILGKVIVLYDACESGSFIPLLTPPEGKERVVATSTKSGERAIFATGGYDSFSYKFFVNLFIGGKFYYDAFVSAKKSIQLIYNQTPLIDVNGNGIGSDEEDIKLADDIKLGNENRFGDDMPTIGSHTPDQKLQGELCVLLYAENVKDPDGIEKVWAVITPTYATGDSSEPITEVPNVSLNKVGDNDRYEAEYCGFKDKGDYDVVIYAADKKGFLRFPVDKEDKITVTQTKPKGDINNDGKLGLEDVIKGLKILGVSDGSETVRRDTVPPIADVNGDGKIGLEEVIYVLQKIAVAD